MMNPLLLILYLISLSLYLPLNKRPSRFYFPSKIDHYLPLIPSSVWVYSSYYFIQPFTILLLWTRPEITPALITLLVSTLLSSLIWWLLPNGVKRPVLASSKSLSHRLLSYIYSHDGDSNGFPSGHISHSIICSYFLVLSFPHLLIPIFIWCLAICVSTLTTKQHYIFDFIFTVPFTMMIIQAVLFAL